MIFIGIKYAYIRSSTKMMRVSVCYVVLDPLDQIQCKQNFCVKPGLAFSFKKCIVQWLCMALKCTGNLQKNKEMAKNHEYYWINNQIMEQASLQNKEIKRLYVLPHAHMARIICEKCCWRVLLKILAYLLYTLYLFSKF